MTIEKEYEAVVSFANTQILLAISSTHTHLDHNITLIQGDSQPKENMFQDDAGHQFAAIQVTQRRDGRHRARRGRVWGHLARS